MSVNIDLTSFSHCSGHAAYHSQRLVHRHMTIILLITVTATHTFPHQLEAPDVAIAISVTEQQDDVHASMSTNIANLTCLNLKVPPITMSRLSTPPKVITLLKEGPISHKTSMTSLMVCITLQAMKCRLIPLVLLPLTSNAR